MNFFEPDTVSRQITESDIRGLFEESMDIADSLWQLRRGATFEFVLAEDDKSGMKIVDAMLKDIEDWIAVLNQMKQGVISVARKATNIKA